MLRLAVECLVRLDHRAKAADGTGDGAGLLTQLPYEVIERHLAVVAPEVPERERLGLVMALPGDRPEEGRAIVDEALATEDIGLLSWRVVPIDPAALSQRATHRCASSKRSSPPLGWDEETFERRLFLARKAMERKGTHLEGFTIPSASCRTVVYKGLFTASKIDQFYWDLRDPRFETSFAIFHQRYSTNTFPSWSIAQPFRCVAHNGEINTIRSNRAWMVGREVNATSQCGGSGLASCDRSSSPSSRTRAAWTMPSSSCCAPADRWPTSRRCFSPRPGRTSPTSIPTARLLRVPRLLDRAVGRAGGGRRHRRQGAAGSNGPQRVAARSVGDHTRCGPGCIRGRGVPGGGGASNRNRTARPGETITFEPATGRIAFSDEIRSELAAQAPYRSWVDAETLYVQDPSTRSRTTASTRRSTSLRVHLRGAPHGAQGHGRGEDPDRLDGERHPAGGLSTTPRRITHYFHELFAQVTNPPMDHPGGTGHVAAHLPGTARIAARRDRPAGPSDRAGVARVVRCRAGAIVRAADLRFFSYWIGAVFAAAEGGGAAPPAGRGMRRG